MKKREHLHEVRNRVNNVASHLETTKGMLDEIMAANLDGEAVAASGSIPNDVIDFLRDCGDEEAGDTEDIAMEARALMVRYGIEQVA